MPYLNCPPEHLPGIIQRQVAINPHSPVKVKFHNGKFRTTQKSPEGGKFISKIVEKRSENARLRLQKKYYGKTDPIIPTELINKLIGDGISKIVIED